MNDAIEDLRRLKRKADLFRSEANEFLSRQENSKARVISLHESQKKLAGLSLLQDDLFKQALLCIEYGIYRAAHVMAWAAFIDFLERKLAEDGLVKVMAARPAWSRYKTIEELRENVAEHQLIEVARELRLLSKGEMKTFHGHLSKRNECAHPSGYSPNLNESLGYVAELLNRIGQIMNRSL